MQVLELDPASLGTLELGDQWVPYVDLYDEGSMPTRVRLGADEYTYSFSMIILGHGATLPQKVRELRASGKKVLAIQRKDRYYVFVG